MKTPHHCDLPQLDRNRLFLTDGGLETTLIFHEKQDLPALAAFVLLESPGGRQALDRYFRSYLEIARQHELGFILETATWRASADWGRKLGYNDDEIDRLNRESVAMLKEIRAEFQNSVSPLVISGNIGPRGDGYRPEMSMRPTEAADYHRHQILSFREAATDMVTAMTIPYLAEGLGIAQAAQDVGMPSVISFTLETDGRLPSGESLQQAVEEIDAATNGAPAYYMINCAHPSHFASILDGAAWTDRIGAVRANASRRSHAELDEATELDDGQPQELGADYVALKKRLRHLNVLGGCCGTDHRHIAAICQAVLHEEIAPTLR